jgi:hypothetical protein
VPLVDLQCVASMIPHRACAAGKHSTHRMNWREETVYPVKRVAFEGTFFYAFPGPAPGS